MSTHWRRALTYGVGVALIHRLLLTIWLALAWSFIGSYLPTTTRSDFHATADAHLPTLTTPFEQNLLGVWRRWDAVHYLDLAYNGYRTDQAGSTVFGALTPFLLRAVSVVTGGSADIASILVQTVAFAIALTLLYRICDVYYEPDTQPSSPAEANDRDQRPSLGRTAVLATALLPLSFYFAAPMSESLYLALSLAVFYLALRGRWFAAALFGFLAALTRSQGVILAVVAGLFLLEQRGFKLNQPSTWIPSGLRGLRTVWILLLIPAGFFAFVLYRESVGLPSLGDTYANYSYHFFVNPLEGIWINIQWIAAHPLEAFTTLDVLVMIASFALLIISLRFSQHRRLPLFAFTLGHLLVYVSKINWFWGTNDQVLFSQSFARYAVVLFPLIILITDGVRRLPKLARIGIGILSGLLLLIASAFYTVALVGP